MPMHFAILQKWDGESQESICMEYPEEKKEECLRMVEGLRRSAKKNKYPVKYRLVELDGVMNYEGRKEDEDRKRNKVDRIIVTNGKIIDDIPLYVQRDLKRRTDG